MEPVDEPSWVELVRGDGWRLVEPARDPYWAQAEGRVPCREVDFGEEYGGVELSTSYCGYITLSQALLHAVHEGELLELSAWHSPLISAEPAEGLIALGLGGETLWSKRLVIPAEAESWTLELRLERGIEAGEPVLFHVSNHGANSYTFYRLRVARSPVAARVD